jgi:CelD/BcsL family acetyltransferase involved in cellulose biosynthesis
MAEFTVELVRGVADLERHRDAWQALAEGALEPNPFFEPSFLLPILHHLTPEPSVRTLLVWRRAAGAATLVGLSPVARSERTKRLPIASFGTWRHPHMLLGTPLLARDHAAPALRAVLDWARSADRLGRVLRLDRVTADGPFAALVRETLAGVGCEPLVDLDYTRPLYRPRGSFDEHLRQVVSAQHRRDFGRKRRRLEAAGPVSVTETTGPGGIAALAAEFLRLEARGWKGRGGTALALSPAEAAFFVEMLEGFAARERIHLVAVRLDGEPVGMTCTLLAGEGGFVFKTAYDETHRANSPGLLSELELLRFLVAHPAIRWVDSCTALNPRSALVQLWPDGRRIETLLVPTGDLLGDRFVASLPLLKRLARWRSPAPAAH